MFREALERLSLASCKLTLAPLRGGGACHHFKEHQNLGTVQFAGRWRRPETLRHYLQEALGVHALANAPSEARELLALAFSRVSVLDAPPQRARTVLLGR